MKVVCEVKLGKLCSSLRPLEDEMILGWFGVGALEKKREKI